MCFSLCERLSLKIWLALLASASALVLAAALAGQYGLGWHPCDLCLEQRYPYAAVIVVSLAGAFLLRSHRGRWIALLLCSLLFAADFTIAAYHVGVEWGAFKAPGGCAGTDGEGMTLEEIRAAIAGAPLVSCDQAMAYVLGLSLAAWNALAAAALTALSIGLLWKKRSVA